MAHVGIELTLWSAFRESENPVFVPCILKYSSDLHISLIPVLLLGSLGIGKRCFESEIVVQIPIRLLTDFCFHEKAARCPSSYPKAFRLLPKMAAARYVLSNSKRFGLPPKTLPPGCLSEVGQPVLTYGVLGLFLVLYTIQSYLVVQRGATDAEQCRSHRAVALCLFQRMDDLFLLHIV